MVKLENWSFVTNEWHGRQRDPYPDEFVAPQAGMCLHGKVFGHPKIEDGHRAHTSRVFRRLPNGLLETATGTLYELGAPNPQYSLWMDEDLYRGLLEVSK